MFAPHSQRRFAIQYAVHHFSCQILLSLSTSTFGILGSQKISFVFGNVEKLLVLFDRDYSHFATSDFQNLRSHNRSSYARARGAMSSIHSTSSSILKITRQSCTRRR